MSEQLRPDSAPGAVTHGGKTNRRDALKYGIGAVLGAGGALGGLYGAAQAGWLDGIVRDVLRGDGSRYRQAAWWSNIETDADMAKWPHFPGNPNTSQFDMDEWPVGFFSTYRGLYSDQHREMPGAWEAMAFRVGDGRVNVGAMPNGEPLFTSRESDFDSLLLGMRMGPGELRAMPGFWLQEEQKYIPARAGATALLPLMAQADVARDMPGAFYI